MLRMTLPHEPSPPRTLTQEQFIAEIQALQADGFADAPAGPVTIEALDGDGRVSWRAYYTSFAGLAGLVRELLAERAAQAKG